MYRAHNEQILLISVRQMAHVDYFIHRSNKTERSELILVYFQIKPEAVSIWAPVKGNAITQI